MSDALTDRRSGDGTTPLTVARLHDIAKQIRGEVIVELVNSVEACELSDVRKIGVIVERRINHAFEEFIKR